MYKEGGSHKDKNGVFSLLLVAFRPQIGAVCRGEPANGPGIGHGTSFLAYKTPCAVRSDAAVICVAVGEEAITSLGPSDTQPRVQSCMAACAALTNGLFKRHKRGLVSCHRQED